MGELCLRCRCTARDLDRWAVIGAFGPRIMERRLTGWHHHIDRVTAQRAVIMSRLMRAGLKEEAAVKIVETHERGDSGNITATMDGVVITVSREDLP